MARTSKKISCDVFRAKVKASLADKRPNIPAVSVFKRLRAKHRLKAKVA